MKEWMPLVEPGLDLVLVLILVWYRVNKKFKKEPFKGVRGFLDQNMVEIIIGAMVLPDFLAIIARF